MHLFIFFLVPINTSFIRNAIKRIVFSTTVREALMDSARGSCRTGNGDFSNNDELDSKYLLLDL